MVMRLLPIVMVVVLAALNGAFFFMGSGEEKVVEESTALWDGPVMPGKALALPGKPEGFAASPPLKSEVKTASAKRPAPPSVVAPAKPGTESDRTVAVDKKHVKAGAKKPASGQARIHDGYVVQAGSFVLKLGADILMKRLADRGMEPFIEKGHELVQLNSVQAGPYANLEIATEAESKLKAAGMEARLEETWEGHVIFLRKSILLGYAVQEMEQAEGLGIKPLRMVKIPSDQEVRKVLLGPFATRNRAMEISARIQRLGLAIPIIKRWRDAKTD